MLRSLENPFYSLFFCHCHNQPITEHLPRASCRPTVGGYTRICRKQAYVLATNRGYKGMPKTGIPYTVKDMPKTGYIVTRLMRITSALFSLLSKTIGAFQ